MRTKAYHYEEKVVFTVKNSTSDILDIKRFQAPFKSWRQLFGRYDVATEREAKIRAKRIFIRCLQLIADDLIDREDIFLLPERESGVLLIGDPERMGIDVHDVQRNPEFEHRAVASLVVLNWLFRATIGGAMYRLSLLRPLKARIQENRRKGFKYHSLT